MQVTEKNFAHRNRRRQSEFRKKQLIEATIDCIDSLGISQTTLARIAERAGLSQGNLVFHFHSKDELLEQTLRHLNDEYRGNWLQALDQAGADPASQLRALIQSSFSAKICNRKIIGVWFAFWGESRSRPKYMKVCGDSDREFSARILQLCRQMELLYPARMAADPAALGLESMMDGLWQNFLIGDPGFKRKDAITAVFEFLEVIYPGCLE